MIGGLFVPRGIVIPWMAGGQIQQLKVRRADPRESKYVAVKGGHPLLFGAETLAGHRVAVLAEGEFDAMLIHQEAGDLVGVATLGSCSRRLSGRALGYLLTVKRILVAYDLDADGVIGAEKLLGMSRRMRRIRPPLGMDVTEFWQRGGSVREWLRFERARLERLDHPTAHALARAPSDDAGPTGAAGAMTATTEVAIREQSPHPGLIDRMRELGYVPNSDGLGWVLTPERAAMCIFHDDRPLGPGDLIYCVECRKAAPTIADPLDPG